MLEKSYRSKMGKHDDRKRLLVEGFTYLPPTHTHTPAQGRVAVGGRLREADLHFLQGATF